MTAGPDPNRRSRSPELGMGLQGLDRPLRALNERSRHA